MREDTEIKPEVLTIPSRATVLQCLEEIRKELYCKVKTGRIKDPALEKARNEKARLLIYCCQVEAGVLKDRDIDEMHERVSRLEHVNQAKQITQEWDPCTIEGGK